MKNTFNFKLALVHDWLVNFAGAEKVLEAIYESFPGDLFTLMKNENALKQSSLKKAKVVQSFIHKLPFAASYYRHYLPFFPLAVEHMNLTGYDIVLSSSHCVAKGVITHPEQLHICYCHTPARYAWDLYHQYLQKGKLRSGMKGVVAKAVLHYLRNWDLLNSQRVDHFVANSHFVKKRIEKLYGKPAEVIHPPVDVEKFTPAKKREEYYITVSRLVPYKMVGLIVEAFGLMPDKRLLVIGEGEEMKAIKQYAKKNIEILGSQPFHSMKSYLEKAKAFVFAALEDFGIAPVEAMAAGCPIIAYGKGGVLDSVKPNKNGLFFKMQTKDSICDAIRRFEESGELWDANLIAKSVEKFSKTRFQEEFEKLVRTKSKAFFCR